LNWVTTLMVLREAAKKQPRGFGNPQAGRAGTPRAYALRLAFSDSIGAHF